MTRHVILWFRRDLRLADNPALHAAPARGAVVPVYIHAPDEEAPWAPGGAQKVWLHFTLRALDGDLRALGSRLVIRRGPTLDTLRELVRETGAEAVFWNRLYEPAVIERDRVIEQGLREEGLHIGNGNAALLHEPWEIATGAGTPYRVFTPFLKSLSRRDATPPTTAPTRLPPVPETTRGLAAEALDLLPRTPWDRTIRAAWTPGEKGAHAALERFLDTAADSYAEERDRPCMASTSRLSPHLHFGEIGPRQIRHRIREAAAGRGTDRFLEELGWREFAHHLLYHYPETPETPLDRRFADFPWVEDEARLQAWRRGRTGIPMVDAGMRELWAAGWMHNRLRMVVASFLIKNLRLPWQAGARWFWDTLVDADLANNTLGWQWVAGCGADAAPYFRIFNPVRQGQRFDPAGDYVRRWVPELARLPVKHIHAPWQAPAAALAAAGVVLDRDYPRPLVDLRESRAAALSAFELIKNG